jgi:hypothetical protein
MLLCGSIEWTETTHILILMIKLTNNEKCVLMFSLGAELGRLSRQVKDMPDLKEIAKNDVHRLAMKLCNHDVYVETPKEKEGQ